jgi:hypothetical protein
MILKVEPVKLRAKVNIKVIKNGNFTEANCRPT